MRTCLLVCILFFLNLSKHNYSNSMTYKLNFYTQYNQFYIADKSSPKNTGSRDFWTDEAYETRLAMGEGVLGVGTECYGPVKGELDILDTCIAEIDSSRFDHIVEGGLDLSSGLLQVLDCPNTSVELEVNIKPGKYRVRIYSSNLASVHGDEGDDYYRIEIWPDNNMKRNLLKKYIQQ